MQDFRSLEPLEALSTVGLTVADLLLQLEGACHWVAVSKWEIMQVVENRHQLDRPGGPAAKAHCALTSSPTQGGQGPGRTHGLGEAGSQE